MCAGGPGGRPRRSPSGAIAVLLHGLVILWSFVTLLAKSTVFTIEDFSLLCSFFLSLYSFCILINISVPSFANKWQFSVKHANFHWFLCTLLYFATYNVLPCVI